MPALSPNVRHDYHVERGSALPRPVNHARENHARRLNTAVDAFESLRPGDASEARLAAQIMLCCAQTISMMRQERAARQRPPVTTGERPPLTPLSLAARKSADADQSLPPGS